MLRMRYGPTQLWAFYRSPLGVKLYRYVMGSVITTVVSFSVLTLVFGVLHLWGAVACTVFANVVATVPGYWLNRNWTWGKTGRSDVWREVAPFWILSVVGIAIAMGTATLAADYSRAHDLHSLASTAVVDGANLVAFGLLFVGKYLVFNRMFEAVARRSGEEDPVVIPTRVPATVAGAPVAAPAVTTSFPEPWSATPAAGHVPGAPVRAHLRGGRAVRHTIPATVPTRSGFGEMAGSAVGDT